MLLYTPELAPEVGSANLDPISGTINCVSNNVSKSVPSAFFLINLQLDPTPQIAASCG